MGQLSILIGRNPQCDYIIANPEQHATVSGRHATLSETEDPTVFLFEDHSTNGSYVNGQLVHHATCRITVGDNITLGRTYTLPIMEIARRYFSSSKTTKRVSQFGPEPASAPNATRLVAVAQDKQSPYDPNATRILTETDTPQEPKVITVEKVVERVPSWYWGLFIASVMVAFILGFCVNS